MVEESTTDLTPVKPPGTPLTDCQKATAEIAKYSNWDVELMTAIAKAESKKHSCDPAGHNLTMTENHGVCVGSYGALQVGCVHYNGEDVNDLKTNVAIAHKVWLEQGYTAWTQYNNGIYRRFL